MGRVDGAFTVKKWDETPLTDANALPNMTQAFVTYTLTDGIVGEATIAYVMAYRPDKSASFVGLARVTGKIEGREGSFMMQDIGTFENEVARGRWTILHGFGTGGLREIRGDGHFAATHDGATYSLEVTF